MRLIDADYLKNLPFERLIHTDFGETAIPIEEIDDAPTVEIPNHGGQVVPDMLQGWKYEERPQGEWISLANGNGINRGRKCSLCGKIVEFSENFCPQCGADMRGNDNG